MNFWSVFPKWLKVVTIIIGLPAFLAWAYLILSAKFFEQETLGLIIFGLFGFVALLQLIFIARAFWRMEI